MEKGVEILNFWSMREGDAALPDPNRPWMTNIGMYDANNSSWYYLPPYQPNSNGIKQSWGHFWALNQNPASLQGNYVSGAAVTVTNAAAYEFKAYGSSKCGRYTVVLINQSTSTLSVKINLGPNGPPVTVANVTGTLNMAEDGVAETNVDLSTNYYDYDTNVAHAQTDRIRADETVILTYDRCGNIVYAARLYKGKPAAESIFHYGPYGEFCDCD